MLLVVLAALAAWGWRRYGRAHREVVERREFTRRLLRDRESERRHIAGELHSNLGQNLLIIKNRAEMGLRANGDHDSARDQLREISTLCSHAIAESRRLAQGLGPRHLAEIGLTGALDAMVDRVAAASTIQFRRRLEPMDGVFDSDAAINIYRIAQEALNNVLKHSRAHHTKVELVRDLTEVRLVVEDDGNGFETSANSEGPHSGLGLAEMKERARILGGHFDVTRIPDGGIRLSLSVPISEQTGPPAMNGTPSNGSNREKQVPTEPI